jgi:hypothetical protein
VYFQLAGYAVPLEAGSPAIAVTASVVFRTDAAALRWLNRVFAVAEAVFQSAAEVRYMVYECHAEAHPVRSS